LKKEAFDISDVQEEKGNFGGGIGYRERGTQLYYDSQISNPKREEG